MIYNYVIKDYTADDFSNEFECSSISDDLELVAEQIAQRHYHEDPCDPDYFECIVGIKNSEGKPQWFTITAAPDIRFYTRGLDGQEQKVSST
jgi:hypothetical protein